MWYVLINVINENHQKNTQMVFSDILAIKKEIENSLEAMVKALDDIKQTTSDLRYLSLNARIEAARAGEQGRGFDVVAQQVDGSAQSVRNMTAEIAKVNLNIASVIKRIETSLNKLN
jgi:methyl-accepting chemotaxis protein